MVLPLLLQLAVRTETGAEYEQRHRAQAQGRERKVGSGRAATSAVVADPVWPLRSVQSLIPHWGSRGACPAGVPQAHQRMGNEPLPVSDARPKAALDLGQTVGQWCGDLAADVWER